MNDVNVGNVTDGTMGSLRVVALSLSDSSLAFEPAAPRKHLDEEFVNASFNAFDHLK